MWELISSAAGKVLPWLADKLPALIGAGMSFLGGSKDRDSSEDQTAANIQMQKEFAQNGVTWRVEDAKRAGIHPLAALGGGGPSFSPISSTFDHPLKQAGQDLTRAMTAVSTSGQKELQDLEIQIRKAELQRIQLENVGIAKNIETPTFPDALNNQRWWDPKDIAKIQPQPSQPIVSSALGEEAGIHPFHKNVIDSQGRIRKIFGKATEEAMENDLPGIIKNYFYEGVDTVGRWKKALENLSGVAKHDRPKPPNIPGVNPNHLDYSWATGDWSINPKYIHLYDDLIRTGKQSYKKHLNTLVPDIMGKAHP